MPLADWASFGMRPKRKVCFGPVSSRNWLNQPGGKLSFTYCKRIIDFDSRPLKLLHVPSSDFRHDERYNILSLSCGRIVKSLRFKTLVLSMSNLHEGGFVSKSTIQPNILSRGHCSSYPEI